jgi:hypothetical protein
MHIAFARLLEKFEIRDRREKRKEMRFSCYAMVTGDRGKIDALYAPGLRGSRSLNVNNDSAVLPINPKRHLQ